MINKSIFPGLLFVVIIGFISQLISPYIYIGSIGTAILIGLFVNNLFRIHSIFDDGISFSEKHLLSIAIIFMGVNLDVSVIKEVDNNFFLSIIAIIAVAFVVAYVVGRILKISKGLSILVGFGNAICGASAIAGASSILKSKKEDVVVSIAVINFIGAISIFFLPILIKILNIDDVLQQGFIIGSTIQAVGQVSAAGYILNESTGDFAIIVKMLRILLLVPILLITSILINKNMKLINRVLNIPYFIVGFVFLFIIQNFGLFPTYIIDSFNYLSDYFLLLAMAGIGMRVSINQLAKTGKKVFILSLFVFLFQIFIAIQIVT